MSIAKIAQVFLAGCCALLLANCASATPATRMQLRPAAFAALSSHQKDLVMKGEISEGMSRDAVWIAWGRPSRIANAGEGGATFEIWRYTGLQPIYHTSIGVGIGIGGYHGRRHTRGYYSEPFFDYNYGPDYVPYTAAQVKFRNGVVKTWERGVSFPD
jgi:hypothetical protein